MSISQERSDKELIAHDMLKIDNLTQNLKNVNKDLMALITAYLLAYPLKNVKTKSELVDYLAHMKAQSYLLKIRAAHILRRANMVSTQEVSNIIEKAWIRGNLDTQNKLLAKGSITSIEKPTLVKENPKFKIIVNKIEEKPQIIYKQLLTSTNNIYNKTVEQVSAKIVDSNLSLDELTQETLNNIAGDKVPGFIDNGGNRWSAFNYMDMAIATTYMAAYNTASQEAIANAGSNLVIIGSTENPCSDCAPWEGAILAIDPEGYIPEDVQIDGTVEEADNSGLFHPNCGHTMDPY